MLLHDPQMPLLLDQIHRDPRDVLKKLRLARIKFLRLAIHHAETSERQALGRRHGNTGVKSYMRLSRHQRVAGETLVIGRIPHDEGRRLLENRVGAEGHAAVGLISLEAVGALEPLPVAVHKRNGAHRCSRHLRRQGNQVVERRLVTRVENAVIMQPGQTLQLARMPRGGNIRRRSRYSACFG